MCLLNNSSFSQTQLGQKMLTPAFVNIFSHVHGPLMCKESRDLINCCFGQNLCIYLSGLVLFRMQLLVLQKAQDGHN